MFEGVNEIAVVVSTILVVAAGSVWYSPALFGTAWMRGAGLTPEDMEETRPQMLKLFVLAALGNLVLISTLTYLGLLAGKASVSVFELATALSVLVAASMINGPLWEKRPWSYYFINVCFLITVMFGALGVVTYWPW